MIKNMDISPKRTIIINAFNSKVLCPLPTNAISIIPEEKMIKPEPLTSKKGRKRSLDHLTFEEKLMRKKLKNREAAQTSRDRKKARMDELEKAVSLLRKCNNDLAREVKALRTEKNDLKKENDKLKEELCCARVQCTLESTGSAESSSSPLPQGHSSALMQAPAFLYQMIFLQMIAFHGSLTTTNTTPHCLKTFCSQKLAMTRIASNCSMKWKLQNRNYWNPVNQHYLHVVAVT